MLMGNEEVVSSSLYISKPQSGNFSYRVTETRLCGNILTSSVFVPAIFLDFFSQILITMLAIITKNYTTGQLSFSNFSM